MCSSLVRQLLRFSGGFELPLVSRDPVKVSLSVVASVPKKARTESPEPTFIEQLQSGDGFAHIAFRFIESNRVARSKSGVESRRLHFLSHAPHKLVFHVHLSLVSPLAS